MAESADRMESSMSATADASVKSAIGTDDGVGIDLKFAFNVNAMIQNILNIRHEYSTVHELGRE